MTACLQVLNRLAPGKGLEPPSEPVSRGTLTNRGWNWEIGPVSLTSQLLIQGPGGELVPARRRAALFLSTPPMPLSPLEDTLGTQGFLSAPSHLTLSGGFNSVTVPSCLSSREHGEMCLGVCPILQNVTFHSRTRL